MSVVTSYVYDALGRIVSVTDALGNSTGYAYDANGNTNSIAYESINRAVKNTDALGNATEFVYDNMNHVVLMTGAFP